jgi:molybdenum cofactor cytidylyltransferase
MSDSNVAIILLAAGSSSRLGQSKQLLSVKGETLLSKSVNAAIGSGAKKVIIVLGANEHEHRKALDMLPIQIVYNPTWQKGMGNSLKIGLAYLLKFDPTTEAIITMVCDQPFVKASHLKKMMARFKETKSPIVASFYSNLVGVPALFDKSLFEKLASIGDEHGAKKFIQQNSENVSLVEFPEGAIDIDTPEDVKKFLS